MYTFEVDAHVHSVASVHAYSTIEECARNAAGKGIRCIAITDHCTADFAQRERSIEAIHNTVCLPGTMHGVRVLRGVEIDIVDEAGNLAFYDQPGPFGSALSGLDFLLRSRELVIASVHQSFGADKGTIARNTRMYQKVLEHPHVHILGHIGRTQRPIDLDAICRTAYETGKMIEINNHSLKLGEAIVETCTLVARKCMEHGVYIAVNSDAHSGFGIGEFTQAQALLEKVGFPNELIANATQEKFLSILEAIKQNR